MRQMYGNSVFTRLRFWMVPPLLALISSTVNASDNRACIDRKVAFDGIKTLHYSPVLGDALSTVPIYAQYPSNCPDDSPACQASSFAVPGDVVAVAKTCGPWAYVQRVGTGKVVEGWVQTHKLKDRNARVPFDDGPPRGRDSPEYLSTPPSSASQPHRIRVKLTEGDGTPVCEAYLQRLNQTMFHEPPSCGRPENEQIPGFARLNRVRLTPAQVNGDYVTAFTLTHVLAATEKLVKPAADRTDLAAIELDDGKPAGSVKALTDPVDISAWRFDPPVDIDNDGRPDNVVIWRGFPPSWSSSDAADNCGVFVDSSRAITGSDQFPLIFSSGYKTVDTARTLEVFADPARSSHEIPMTPYGDSVEIFEYDGKYYFDTTKPTDGASVIYENDIYVYLREQGKTHQVCKYENLQSQWDPLQLNY